MSNRELVVDAYLIYICAVESPIHTILRTTYKNNLRTLIEELYDAIDSVRNKDDQTQLHTFVWITMFDNNFERFFRYIEVLRLESTPKNVIKLIKMSSKEELLRCDSKWLTYSDSDATDEEVVDDVETMNDMIFD